MRLMGVFCGLLVTVAAGTALLASAGPPALASAPAAPTAPAGPTAPTAPAAPSAPAAPTAPSARHAGRGPERPGYGNPKGHVAVPPLGRPVSTKHPDHVIGNGTPASCTSAAVVRAVAKGGIIVFRCGPKPVTIVMRATAKVVNTSRRVVIDGGGKVTLSGGGKRRILYLNTCDPRQVFTTTHCFNQQWPKLIVQNLTFSGGNAQVRQTKTSNYGGGAIFAEGGQLKVVNSGFFGNRCYRSGPDLGGAAIRAIGQWQKRPVYITRDSFRGGRCSNGSALSSIGVSWVVLNSLMIDNKAIGFGANRAPSGSAGGGSGGAIYTDGNRYSVVVGGTVMRDNSAREGGGAIFYVSDDNTGTLTIEHSRLHHNPSAVFWTRPYVGVFYKSSGHPKVIDSTLN